MRSATLIFLFLLLLAYPALSKPHTDVVAAVNSRHITLQPKATGGLGPLNLKLSIRNLRADSVYVRLAPGLYFKAADTGAQDLFTVQEVLVALGPRETRELLVQGFCTKASKHAPQPNGGYTFTGYAESKLKELASLLSKFEPLALSYGQMLVWAITDQRDMYPLTVHTSLVEPAKAAVAYVVGATGLKSVAVTGGGELNAAPALEVFSKKGVLAFHNPVAQVATFKMYDAQGKELYTYFKDRQLTSGVKIYDFAANDMIPAGSDPVYYYKVTNAAGKLIAQVKVDRNYTFQEVYAQPLSFKFEYVLQKPVKQARLNVYTLDGKLVEELKQYREITAGGHTTQLRFFHLYPKGTAFVAKLETADGVVLKEQKL